MTVPSLRSIFDIQPGQLYRATDPRSPLSTSEMVVDRLVRDDLGMLHVVLLDLDGREVSLFAEQFEAAVASGYLSMLDGALHAYA